MSQSFFANALIVALLTCPASNMVAEGFIPDDTIRSSHVMGPLSATAAYASVPIERSLRSNATSDDINSSEDRVGLAELRVILHDLPSKISSDFKRNLLWYRFKFLKFSTMKPDELFANPKFLGWFNDVKSKYKNKPTKAFMQIYLVLSDHCKDEAALTAFLYVESKSEKSGMKYDARALLNAQAEKWKATRKNAASVYKLLKLDQTQVDNPFDNPVFVRWALLLKPTPPSMFYGQPKKKVYEKVYEKLLIQCKYEDVAVAKALITGIKKRGGDTKRIAHDMAKYWLVEEQLAGKNNRMAAWLDLTASNDADADIKYIMDYYESLYQKGSMDIITMFKATFGDAKVACMLEAADVLVAFGKPMQELRKAQFDYWKERYPYGPKEMLEDGIPDEDLYHKIMDDYDMKPTLDAMVFTEPRR